MPLRLVDAEALRSRPPSRVLIAGRSGAGKTTAATKLAPLLNLPRVELDELYYREKWQVRPEFVADVARETEIPRWITEWHYPEVNGMLARRADLLVWLDYSVSLTLTSLLLRTVLRALHDEVLWSGNREPPLHAFLTDREHIMRYGWSTRHETRDELRRLPGELGDRSLDVLRFRRPRAFSCWLDQLTGAVPTTATGRGTDADRVR